MDSDGPKYHNPYVLGDTFITPNVTMENPSKMHEEHNDCDPAHLDPVGTAAMEEAPFVEGDSDDTGSEGFSHRRHHGAKVHWHFGEASPGLLAFTAVATILCIGSLITMSVGWALWLKPNAGVSKINAAVAAYNPSTSLLGDSTGSAATLTNATPAVVLSQAVLDSRLVTREITGWTKGLDTTVVGGIAARTRTAVTYDGASAVRVSLTRSRQPTATMSVVVPDPHRQFSSHVEGKDCQDTCIGLGSREEGGTYAKNCKSSNHVTTCECDCYFRRYLTTACYVLDDQHDRRPSPSLELRAGRPTCYPPFTLEAGHEYTNRTPTKATAVELRTSDDPLLVALAVSGGTLHFEQVALWLKIGIVFTVLTVMFGAIAATVGFIIRDDVVTCGHK